MNEKEILEGNKLIAEFMGIAPVNIHEKDKRFKPEFIYNIPEHSYETFNEYGSSEMECSYTMSELAYHTNDGIGLCQFSKNCTRHSMRRMYARHQICQIITLIMIFHGSHTASEKAG